MAINLTPEANKLITDYQLREALPSKASAVNRLILLSLGQHQSAPQSLPQPTAQATPAVPVAPVAPSALSGFKL